MAGVGPAQLGAKVQRTRVPPAPVNPTITPGAQVIVAVKKPHTTPARVRILLKTDAKFRRKGTLGRVVTPTSGDIHFFRAEKGGAEITFDGKDNVFEGLQLSGGVPVFAEARSASGNLEDVQLTLTLTT